MVTFLVGKKIFEHLVLIVSLSDIISSRYCTKYANDKQFIISVIITKKLRHPRHLSAGDEGAMVVPASAEVVESVSVWVVVVGPVGGVVAVPSVVEVSVPPGLRISLGLSLTLLNLDLLSSGSWGNNASIGAWDSDSHVVLAAGGGGVD